MTHPTLVILHGANGCAAEMEPLIRALKGYRICVPNLLGHGGRPVPDALDFEAIVADVAAWLDRKEIGAAHFLGYSFGGYVSLALALREPRRVLSVTAMATVYRWTPEMVRHVVYLADPERLARPGNPRREQMERAHGPQWRKVSENNRALFAALGERMPLSDDLVQDLKTPVLVLSGALDPLAPAAEAIHLARALGNARLGLWPGPAHPLRSIPLREVEGAVGTFINQVEEGRFVPGPPLRLEQPLARDGLTGADLQMGLGRRK